MPTTAAIVIPLSRRPVSRCATSPRKIRQRLLGSIRGHGLRVGVLALTVIAGFRTPWRAIGVLNRRLGLIRSIFLCYAGNASYSRRYCYDRHRDSLRWRAAPIGLFRQDGALGIVLASPMTEAEFMRRRNEPDLRRLLARLERIAADLGVSQIRLAGILPSHLKRRGIAVATDGRHQIAGVVEGALDLVLQREFAGRAPTIVILGGDGFVGSRVRDRLLQRGLEVRVVDSARGVTAFPPELASERVLLLDVSRKGVLQGLRSQIPPGTVILNETFPEPDPWLVRELSRDGCRVHHIAGVRARVWPSLPGGYSGAVPCCAAHGERNLEPVIRSLGGSRAPS